MQTIYRSNAKAFIYHSTTRMVWLLTLVFVLPLASAQSTETASTEASQQAEHIAYQLKSNHNLAKAVYLTRVADQLSLSFVSEAQLENRWQQALTENIEPETNFSHINTHALMAQVLINFSHGMTLNRWRMVDLTPNQTLPALTEQMAPAGQFRAWLNLSHYWQIILQRFATQGSIEWLGFDDIEKSKPHKPLSVQLTATFAYIATSQQPKALKTNQNDTQVTDAMPLKQSIIEFSRQWSEVERLPEILLKQSHHRQQELWLAWAYDWIELYQQVELSSQLLTATEQNLFSQYIDASQKLWTERQTIIQARDVFLYNLIEQIFQQLPQKFKNPDHLDKKLTDNILTLATGIQQPDDYISQPVREQLQKNLEVCLNLSNPMPPNPQQPIAEHQLTSCLSEFSQWAQQAAFEPGLAGMAAALENTINLERVLELPPQQIINYLPAQMIKDQTCIDQIKPKPNTFEWLLAIESLNWLHDRWPSLVSAQDMDDKTSELIATGLQSYNYPDCFNSTKLLGQEFNQLEQKWTAVKQAIRLYIKDYRNSQLAANSDIDFFQNTDQNTDAVPANLVIKACKVSTACGAYIELEPDNKVLQLFPNHLKLAQQLKLGTLSICYDEVQWQERKSLPAELKNDKIARYEGQLAMTLVGKYQNKTVFTQQLQTVDRYVYLFAENSPEVLDMSCPLPIIGKQITTSLDRGTFGLLPNRLTFLTAQKVDVNALIKSHWPSWQNSLGSNQYDIVDAMDAVKNLVNEAFLQHSNAVQQQIYRKLTTNNPSRINDSALSFAVFEYLTDRQRLLATVQALFPELYQKNINIRRSLAGNEALVDLDFFKQSYNAQLNLMNMMDQSDALFEQHKPAWFELQPMHNERFLQPTIQQFQQRYSVATEPPTETSEKP